MPLDLIAFDRAASVRTIDADGHMHVSSSIISAAQVNPYRGSEINDWKALGLQADRIYQLLRDPEALAKATPSVNGKPLIVIHKAMTAEDHDREVVVGSVNNAIWDDPHLKAELVIWDGEAIKDIEDDTMRDLSCGYAYRCVMEPGSFQGVSYDGRMVDIRFNHTALVRAGRVEGAIVGDEALPTQENDMTKPLSRKALLASAALVTYLRPKLATDAKLDVRPLLVGITRANWRAKRTGVIAKVKAAAKGKLATDATLDDLPDLFMALDSEEMDPDTMDSEVDPEGTNAKDASSEVLMSFLREHLSEEELEKCAELMAEEAGPEGETAEDKKMRMDKARDKRAADKAIRDKAAEDKRAKDAKARDEETPEEKKEREAKEAKEAKAAKEADDARRARDAEPTVTKKAMDAALATVRRDTETAVITRLNAVHAARAAVKPWVGELSPDLALDSADAVYKTALDLLAVDPEDAHPSSYRHILMAQPKPGASSKTPALAMDARAAASFNTRFPGAARLRVV